MIQRIQTIYYLIGLLILTIGLLVPIISWSDKQDVLDNQWLTYSVYAYVFGVVGLFVTILKFKPLKTQLILGRIFLLHTLLICAINSIVVYTHSWNVTLDFEITWSFYILFLSPIAIFLGNRGVKKDIQLLNSLNRLR